MTAVHLPVAAPHAVQATPRAGHLSGSANVLTGSPQPCTQMGTYQYQRRVERLQRQGLNVYDFGSRVLKEQCYGAAAGPAGRQAAAGAGSRGRASPPARHACPVRGPRLPPPFLALQARTWLRCSSSWGSRATSTPGTG